MELDDRIKKIVADSREKEHKVSDDILAKASAQLEAHFSGIQILTKSGDPPAEILSVAEDLGIDIIAVGGSGMRGITGIVGSVSRYILNHAACSVLIGKKTP
jgi:nucleotide-binding universal stress UspA family protein